MENLQTFLLQQGGHTREWEGLSISVLENPKPALTDDTHKEFVDDLIDKLQVITSQSFGIELEEQSSDGVRDHVVNVDTLAFLHNRDTVLGFASSKTFCHDRSFYLHGVAIAQQFKGRGGGIILTRTLVEMANLPQIAFTTQNPIMFCLLKSMCSKVYPSPEQTVVPMNLQDLGTRLMAGRAGEFDKTSFIAYKLYGRCLYDTIPTCKDPEVNQWFMKALNIEVGLTRNAFLFIGDRKV